MLFGYSEKIKDSEISDNLALYIGLHYENLFYAKKESELKEEDNNEE